MNINSHYFNIFWSRNYKLKESFEKDCAHGRTKYLLNILLNIIVLLFVYCVCCEKRIISFICIYYDRCAVQSLIYPRQTREQVLSKSLIDFCIDFPRPRSFNLKSKRPYRYKTTIPLTITIIWFYFVTVFYLFKMVYCLSDLINLNVVALLV